MIDGYGDFIISYGFGLLVVLQSLMLARRFSLTFKSNVDLSQNLDKIVKKRTLELKQRNAQVVSQKEELESTLISLRRTQDQLIQFEKMASLGRLVAGFAHEINTSNQTANLILANMQKAEILIQSFKQVSVDQFMEQKRMIKFRSYVKDIIRSLSPKLKEKEIGINLNINDNIEVETYPGAFSQIFSNLIINSLIHGFDNMDKGIISISADASMRKLNIQYQDNGKGIAPVIFNKVIDPFFTTNKGAGPGLGLHIVYNIITQKLKGTIECSSQPGNGVTFQMHFPF